MLGEAFIAAPHLGQLGTFETKFPSPLHLVCQKSGERVNTGCYRCLFEQFFLVIPAACRSRDRA